MLKDKRKGREKQEKTEGVENQLVKYLKPVLSRLNEKIDCRLVKTFLGSVMGIMKHRHRNNGLLLSELGGYLLGSASCWAGTKRISNLLGCQKWEAGEIEKFQWEQAHRRVEELQEQGERPLVIWDESVVEKPESVEVERLCAVCSSKAKRLKRIKPGFFNPPGRRPICVLGFHWLQVLVIGHKGPPTLAYVRWWTTRGEEASQKREEQSEVFDHIDGLWGKEISHVWDRGFCGHSLVDTGFYTWCPFYPALAKELPTPG